MKIYEQLSKIGFLTRYSYKFLFVAFLGIHVPLVGIIAFVVLTQGQSLNPISVIVIALVLTLLATAVTLYFLDKLLEPLTQSKNALEGYVKHSELPQLPVIYTDEAGILMQQLQYTILKLDELVRAKDDVVSLISHDIRTPLSHIISYAELIKTFAESDKSKKYANEIMNSGNQQLEMLESMLKLIKQQGVSLADMEKVEVNAVDLINETIHQNEVIINSKNINIDLDIPPLLKLNVNSGLFSHVLQNVLHNACKFSKEGETILISAEDVDDQFTTIMIKDNGIGFDPKNAEGIFDKFTKLGQTGTNGEISTGLGLYVTKSIVKKHGGIITAYSEGKDKGAEIKITLPKVH